MATPDDFGRLLRARDPIIALLRRDITENRRRVGSLERGLAALGERVDVLAEKDEIARAVADELHRRGPTFPLSWWTRGLAILAALVAIAGGIKGLIG